MDYDYEWLAATKEANKQKRIENLIAYMESSRGTTETKAKARRLVAKELGIE